ncbi:MFS transporter [Gloeocapsopsis crepidinum LEGE 06123]|uniref:MFS transporter n=1 Tax=Gloeocapsopsis crepidinum LEGE 06123 TaxID=588587 RepID=A0ABR9UT14_9CHRO|nr:MFS transporter [Gloeocapsopsis crepidinum]MBE9190750.1 MFS transporter [Gloeocapsopsis crepidinum LEGE 06123]
MFQNTEILLEPDHALSWIAQVPVTPGAVTPAEAALVFSGPRFFVALISGVILAFAIQLVLTNLSVAAGISYLGHSSDSDSDSSSSGSDSVGGTIRKIGTAVGIWTLVTVSVALFIACLLAVELSLLTLDVGLGAILGLVIWGAYFLLLFWFSSTTVGSLIGSVVNTATSGFQAIVGTATAALGAKAVNNQVVATAEAAAAAVRREIGSAIDPLTIRENIEDYLDTLRPPELDISNIRKEFENLLNDPQLREIAGTEDLRNIDRQKFVELVSTRTDLSRRDINRIVDQLESVWRQVVSQQAPQKDRLGELVDYLKSAQPGQAKTDELSAKVDQLIAEVRSGKGTTQGSTAGGVGPIQSTIQQGMTTLMGLVMGRADLSDFDVEKILSSLSQARDKATDQAGKVADQVGIKSAAVPYNTIRADVENYLLNTYSWQINREKVNQEFRDVLYDPAADPGTVRRQIEQISRQDFADLLQQRGVFTQAKIQEIADQLESIRQEVLTIVRAEEEREAVQDLQRRVESYLLVTSKADLTPEKMAQDFKPLLEDEETDHEVLTLRLARLESGSLRPILLQRNDITPEEAETILAAVEDVRQQVLFESQNVADQAKQQAETLWINLESYLRNTGKDELNPEGIKRDLQKLLEDPQAGAAAVQARLSRFDRDTLFQLLNQRDDLSEEQINQVLQQVEGTWYDITHMPQIVAGKAKEQYDSVTQTIAEYLRNTGKDELNPEGIQRDFAKLFENPQAGAVALRRRLAQVDRDTLVKLLSQRQDLSEEQVNQIINQIQVSIRDIIRSPRRLAARTQARVQNFQQNLEDYLRSTGKDELNPEAIKRELYLLLNDPRAGAESLGDRLSHFDRSTIIALLQARGDMSEEEAARTVDQVLAVRDQFVEQIRAIQRRIQDVIDGVFGRIRNYLNSLDRPELNYDGIKKDVRKLFDDPQAGFDAIRDRLGSFNRETLVAIMSSREDISEADANRIIDQIEGARNNVLQRAERVQQEAQRRLEQVKVQAQRQAEETRKAAGSAAWWLFATAVVSAIAAAMGGVIAVLS